MKQGNTMFTKKNSSESASIAVERATYSIDEFCTAHGIGKAHFYVMRKRGDGPRVMKVGTRTLISVEAAAEWRLAREVA